MAEVKICPRCGREMESAFEQFGFCGDCYWDDQTDADGTINED